MYCVNRNYPFYFLWFIIERGYSGRVVIIYLCMGLHA